jgi:hypothetical protein
MNCTLQALLQNTVALELNHLTSWATPRRNLRNPKARIFMRILAGFDENSKEREQENRTETVFRLAAMVVLLSISLFV